MRSSDIYQVPIVHQLWRPWWQSRDDSVPALPVIYGDVSRLACLYLQMDTHDSLDGQEILKLLFISRLKSKNKKLQPTSIYHVDCHGSPHVGPYVKCHPAGTVFKIARACNIKESTTQCACHTQCISDWIDLRLYYLVLFSLSALLKYNWSALNCPYLKCALYSLVTCVYTCEIITAVKIIQHWLKVPARPLSSSLLMSPETTDLLSVPVHCLAFPRIWGKRIT